MKNKKAYCHKECGLLFGFGKLSRSSENFTIGNCYDMIETNGYYIIYTNEYDSSRFYKEDFPKHLINPYFKQFSDFFYTEQEYNRIKNLNELLDG